MAIERATIEVDDRYRGRIRAGLRYQVLNDVRRACRSRQVGWLAFGFDPERLRLVVEGTPGDIGAALKGAGRAVAAALDTHADASVAARGPRVLQRDLDEAVAWAHQGPAEADPTLLSALASPWSSHRDLLGYRHASFFDRRAVMGRVCLAFVHEACGGGPPPLRCKGRRKRPRTSTKRSAQRENLLFLSRVAASVLGVVPADPACFALFAQLARARGWSPKEIGEALLVSPRRVRQLCEKGSTELGIAITALRHPDTLGRLP